MAFGPVVLVGNGLKDEVGAPFIGSVNLLQLRVGKTVFTFGTGPGRVHRRLLTPFSMDRDAGEISGVDFDLRVVTLVFAWIPT